ncbi:uncharacterized protein LOC128554650 [Mercenaria mercenaria]|uniref:uncharacterized protein LOC128554650 n=1 Tax=Mercenaria mercenaria TaxID=6596 RepID=UPI00234F9EAF|nr:uncharacterized protein LOC128554650 [Mercenaria mercenaria]
MSKRVHAHHHAISCDMCGNWQHRKCGSTGITVKQYKAAVAAGSDLAFICAPCELKIPPVDDDHNSVTDDEIQMDLEQTVPHPDSLKPKCIFAIPDSLHPGDF